MNVIAQVRFQSEDRATERRLDYGVWVDSPCVTTTFDVGDTCELVLLCVVNKKVFTFEDRRTDSNQYYSDFTYIDYFDAEDFPFVEVSVIDQTSQATVRHFFKVWREGARFCLAETARRS